ncbi:MAG: DUF1800 domain-containing protein [Gammaproteobacteria bacterium]|nr:DUF1800 domain-containing protein [Gammaproteobacteria bacterium]
MDIDKKNNGKFILDNLQTRREFLKLLGKGLGYSAILTSLPGCGGGGSSPTPVAQIPMASPEYVTLKRTSFGVHRDELASIQAIGINAYLEQQLNYQNINDDNLENTLRTRFPLAFQTPAQLYAGFPENTQDINVDMISATQHRQIFSKRQLYEVMVEFWSDHFNIQLLNGLGPTLKPTDDLQVIRIHALGNFRDLLQASASSPSMIFYLDNFFNQAAAPNENYARELMELHTLGVNGGYTENDIKEVARCFTGWSIRFPNDPDGNPGEFIFRSTIHDNNAKTVLQNTITSNGGQTDGIQVLDILATHLSTAQFISTKLCRRFISDQPDEATINTVTTAFINSNGDIKDTLRALFASNAFQNTSDLKLCRPTEYLAGVIRSLAPDTNYPTDNGILFATAQSILGQLPFNWPTPDGYPDQQTYWGSTGGLLNRWRLSFLSFANVIQEINVFQINYNAMLNGANTLTTIIDAMINNILMRPISSDDKNFLLEWLNTQTGLTNDTALPTETIDKLTPSIASVLISSAYFQLR